MVQKYFSLFNALQQYNKITALLWQRGVGKRSRCLDFVKVGDTYQKALF